MFEDTEMALVGALINNPEHIFEVMGSGLRPEMLNEPPHAALMKSLYDLANAGSQVDTATVTAHLRRAYDEVPAGVEDAAKVAAREMRMSGGIEYYTRTIREAHRNRQMVGALRVAISKCERGRNPEDIITDLLKQIGDDREQTSGITAASDYIISTLAQIENPTNTLKTGWGDFDRISGGFLPKSTCVVGARTGIGKSAFLSAMALKFTAQGYRGLFISNEMRPGSVLKRMATNISGREIKKTHVASGQLADAFEIAARNLWFLDATGMPVEQIVAKARPACMRGDFDFVVVDYIQNIPGKGHIFERVTNATKRITWGLAPLGPTVFIASQLNRDAKARATARPKVTDLLGSDAVGQDAHHVILLHRPDVIAREAYGENWDEKSDAIENVVEALFVKGRESGIGETSFLFDGAAQKYLPYDPRYSEC